MMKKLRTKITILVLVTILFANVGFADTYDTPIKEGLIESVDILSSEDHIDYDKTIYLDLTDMKSKEVHATRGLSFRNYVAIHFKKASDSKFTITVQNLGIDPLDYVRLNLLVTTWSGPCFTNIKEPTILPLFSRKNTFCYANWRSVEQLSTSYARDGTEKIYAPYQKWSTYDY